MNKKYQTFVPIIFILAAFVFILIMFFTVYPKYNEFNDKTQESNQILEDNQTYKEQAKAVIEQNKIKLQSIKQVYESNINAENNNLSAYGTMFDEIIKKAQANGLAIRSIEYNMNPANNEVLNSFSDLYNVCELKFFFVGTYRQLQTFLSDLIDNYQYLVSVSNMDITAFSGNTDYIIIKMGIVLYAKKPSQSSSPFPTQQVAK